MQKSSGCKPGMLPNLLEYTGQPHKIENYLSLNVNSAEAKKPGVREISPSLSSLGFVLSPPDEFLCSFL